jgi:hypothetical protein
MHTSRIVPIRADIHLSTLYSIPGVLVLQRLYRPLKQNDTQRYWQNRILLAFFLLAFFLLALLFSIPKGLNSREQEITLYKEPERISLKR